MVSEYGRPGVSRSERSATKADILLCAGGVPGTEDYKISDTPWYTCEAYNTMSAGVSGKWIGVVK